MLDDDAVLDLGDLTASAIGQVRQLLTSRDFDRWADELARVRNCAHPIRLVGSSQTIDTSTGEILSTYSSADEYGGVTRIPCGNRRASKCPACSRTYAADTWHLIHAGAAGGKGVPETVAGHPMVFATATAPSFGSVHRDSREKRELCRPRRLKSLCPHGRPTWCGRIHTVSDRAVGQPLCADCYDYDSHVIWQWHAPELWRRFTIALNRALARHLGVRPSQLKHLASIQFAKVGEYQRRGVIHFHALIRLDGPKTPDGFESPPATCTADQLAELVVAAFRRVRYDAPAVDERDVTRRLAFGRQLDAQPVRHGNGSELTASQVAGYIAKYATKTIDDPDAYDPRSVHHARIRSTVHVLAERARAFDPTDDNPYALLGRWDHMLGFRGHFSSKSRRYSTTLGRLRNARRRWQAAISRARAAGRVLDLAAFDLDEEGDDTTLVLGNWRYVGQGWANEGETALATAAAARAREHQRTRAATSSNPTNQNSRR